MSNPSKRKGTAFEVAVCDYLRTHGFPYVERRAIRGSKDCGDIAGIPGVVLECKAEKIITLAAYMDELEAEKVNDGAKAGLVVVKRRNAGIERAYCVAELKDAVDFLL